MLENKGDGTVALIRKYLETLGRGAFSQLPNHPPDYGFFINKGHRRLMIDDDD